MVRLGYAFRRPPQQAGALAEAWRPQGFHASSFFCLCVWVCRSCNATRHMFDRKVARTRRTITTNETMRGGVTTRQRQKRTTSTRENVNEMLPNMQPQIARTTQLINRRKGARDDHCEKQNRVNPLGIHNKIAISTARRARRNMARREGQIPEVWKGSKTCHFPFMPHVKI